MSVPAESKASTQKEENPFTRKPRKRPDWVLVMVLAMTLFTLLVVWLIALPYW